MTLVNDAASVSQIQLGQVYPTHERGQDPDSSLASAHRSFTTASHGSEASTVAEQSPASVRPSEVKSRTSEHSSAQHEPSKKREPEEAPDAAVEKAAMIGVTAAGASQAATAPILHDRGRSAGSSESKELGVEDKHGFFAGSIKGPRRKMYKLVVVIFLAITLWLWVCLPIFWGSVYQLTSFLPNINVRFVSFDTDPDALLNGPITRQANYLASLPSSMVHLGWEVRSASDYPNGLDDVRREVELQNSWVTVVVNANATSAWRTAIRTGDASYDPNGAIGIYYMGALFYQVQYLYTESLVKEELSNPLATARGQALQAFNTYAAANAGAVANAARAPQTLGVAFGYSIFDLRPIENGQWASSAPMEASLIYFVILAFIIIFVGGQARTKTGLETRLTFRAKLGLRIGWILLAFFFLSLWQTLVVRAFQVPLQTYLGSGGFVTFWALNYVTIIAAGLALETMLSIVGIPFLPIFLILWIILNITSSFYPLTLMPNFYHLLRWMPFLHNVEAFKIIAFGTNATRRLGYHFGILFAVIGVELICWPLAMFFERWSTDKKERRKVWDQRELPSEGQSA